MELFDETFVPPGLEAVRGRGQRCPRCVWPYLRPVSSADQDRWLCPSCGHCWHIEQGRVRLVDPITCHGCATRPKADCIRQFQHEFPRFGAGAASDDDYVSA